MVTALVNVLVLARYPSFWGLPREFVLSLGAVAFGYFLFSLSCATLLKRNHGLALRIVAGLNSAYCLSSLLIASFFHAQVHGLTWLYLGIESLIVLALASMEWRVGGKCMDQNSK